MDRMRNVDGHLEQAEGPRRDAMDFKWDSATRSYRSDQHFYHISGQLQPPGRYAVFIEQRRYPKYDLLMHGLTLDQAKQWCEMHHAVGADNA